MGQIRVEMLLCLMDEPRCPPASRGVQRIRKKVIVGDRSVPQAIVICVENVKNAEEVMAAMVVPWP